ncbi:MAG: sigma-70 family RNA polymerase sigma factor [Granulosicoccus sp.]
MTIGGSHVHNEYLKELLVLCEKGSESAFKELYRNCAEPLYSLIVRTHGIDANTEQVLQDSFVEIWLKAGTYKPASGPPLAWMASIARHQAAKLLNNSESSESADTRGVMSPAKPGHEIAEDVRMLIQCLEQLPENTRNCIVQAYCDGYSYEELAAQMDEPNEKIKSWIRSALLSLRKSVDEATTVG